MFRDKSLRQQNLQHVKSRIENDPVYKHRNRMKAAKSNHKKLQNHEHREQHKAAMREKMKTAYHTRNTYRKTKKAASRQHSKQVSKLESYKSRQRIVMHRRRHGSESCLNEQPSQNNNTQTTARKTNAQTRAAKTYWARRTKLIAAAKENGRIAMMQKKMASVSGMPLLDTKLLMKKADQRLKRGQKMLTHLHLNLVTKVTYSLEKLPADRSPTEDELVSAFNGHRMHTSSSEAYFWQHCYNMYPKTQTIPVDCDGRAHVFKPVPVQTKSSSETTSTNTDITEVSRWECHSQLCHLPPEAIDGVTVLLRNLASKNSSNCRQFYLHLDDCTNPARDNRLGHSVYCSEYNGCHSLLRPARILSPHSLNSQSTL